jgi:hypothetical protein
MGAMGKFFVVPTDGKRVFVTLDGNDECDDR